MILTDSVDVKDLQYTLVKTRRMAVELITDIYNGEAKEVVKAIKEIENRPINTNLSYKPVNMQKIKEIHSPVKPRVS